MATVKRKGDLGKKASDRKPVYPGLGTSSVLWQGKIERLVWGGLGLGRSEDGKAILLSAPLALFPGEEVEASIHWKARHGEGNVNRWIARDHRRAKAECPVAATCGGCDLWEAGSSIGELKRLMVEDLFSRQLPDAQQWRWLPAPAEAKRHRIQLHWDGRALGFHRRKSHQIVPVTACPAAAQVLSEAIPRLEEALHARILPTKPQRWELATGTPPGMVLATLDPDRAWCLEPDGWHPWEGPVTHQHGEFNLQHSAGGFYQVSPGWAAEAFGSLLKEWDLRGDTLFDLYGGVGFFSALLGHRFQHRCLVEFDAPAVEWARINLQAVGLTSECLAADVAAWVPEHLGTPQDTILLDPPRAGLPPELCERLQGAEAGTLVLVGCDGASFCRDAKRLAPAWKLEALAALDLFPLTHHAECVGLFRKILV
jgi:tRNA/tmRNA/rRNA uracil-C5-methylase (TrmA/RlmC/RlmD family)